MRNGYEDVTHQIVQRFVRKLPATVLFAWTELNAVYGGKYWWKAEVKNLFAITGSRVVEYRWRVAKAN